MFSGYGGLDMAVRATIGGHVAWHCEFDQAPARVLTHHTPHTPNLGDITDVDWDAVEPVDILTGGFPCQDVSSAGQRKGLRPGTRSGLWTHMAYAIDQLHPGLVVIENVRGLLNAEAHSDVEPCPWCVGGTGNGEPVLRALGAVLGDLADLGYDAEWVLVPASDVGAPHRRERVFIVAHPAAHPDSNGGNETIQHDGHNAQAGHGSGIPHQSDRDADGPGPNRELTFGTYAPAVARWEATLGRPAPSPTEPGGDGRPRLSPRFVEWMMGLPDGHVTDPAIGLTRAQQLKILGNGVVPQQAAYAVRTLLRLDVPGPSPATHDALLPTPTTDDAGNAAGRPSGAFRSLARSLLPTPTVNDMGEGKTIQRWDEWTADMKARHGNGNGHGRSLAIEAQRIGRCDP